jgi:hypothetical protein
MRKLAVSAAVSAAVVLTLPLAPSAAAAVLDFNYATTPLATSDQAGLGPLLPVGNGGWISQTYGDVAGLVDASYRYINTSGQAITSLQTYVSGYDELQYVAWTGSSGGGDRAQVELASVNGSIVSLNSFRLGSWASTSGRPESVRVFEIGNTTPIYTFNGAIGVNNLSNLFTLNLQSTSGFIIEWTSPWWTAIDDINSTAAPIPEPGTYGLMALGLLTVAAAAKRRGAR